MEDGTALFWYAIAAAIQSVVPLLIYKVTQIESTFGYLPLRMFTYVLMGVWAPTFWTWLAVVFFDSHEIRNLMHEAIHVSVAGPFCLYWLGLGDILINAVLEDWAWWTLLIVAFLFSVASIAFQAIFVPKVRNWLTNAPIKEYPASMSEKQMAADIITVDSSSNENVDTTDDWDGATPVSNSTNSTADVSGASKLYGIAF